jgi:hypothetical protein
MYDNPDIENSSIVLNHVGIFFSRFRLKRSLMFDESSEGEEIINIINETTRYKMVRGIIKKSQNLVFLILPYPQKPRINKSTEVAMNAIAVYRRGILADDSRLNNPLILVDRFAGKKCKTISIRTAEISK